MEWLSRCSRQVYAFFSMQVDAIASAIYAALQERRSGRVPKLYEVDDQTGAFAIPCNSLATNRP